MIMDLLVKSPRRYLTPANEIQTNGRMIVNPAFK